MPTSSGGSARETVPDFDDLSPEELRKRMNAIRRNKRDTHARKWAGLPRPVSSSHSPPMSYAIPSDDPIVDLSRRLDALAAIILEGRHGLPDSRITSSQPEQPAAAVTNSARPPEWVNDQLTRNTARLVRALWGGNAMSQAELWEYVWRGKPPVKRETIDSAVKRANARLAELPPEITSTCLLEWHDKKLRLVVVERTGFKNESRMVQD